MNSRAKMCGDKASFWSRVRAEAFAARYSQRVYECPVCFCWHCTNKASWREEFFTSEELRRKLATQQCELRAEFNAKAKALNIRIAELERENRQLRLASSGTEP